MNLSTEEAKNRKLPGSDTFRRSHIVYLDDLHRDWSVIALNHEAYKAFLDTILIKDRVELLAERIDVQEWLKQGGFSTNLPPPFKEVGQKRLEYRNYEYLKIACGFEIHLKARLLLLNYVVHIVDKNETAYEALARDQAKRPIQKTELLNIDGFRFDGSQNYLPGIQARSIEFSQLTSKLAYTTAVGLPKKTMDIIKDYRELRNQIHLPGDEVETPALQNLKGVHISELILEFINNEIVTPTNKLALDRKFNFPPLAELKQ